MESLAFPLRLQENGLLRRDEKTNALLALLQMMARTPQGSWQACPNFGLRDLFEHGRQQADVARMAAERINQTMQDLGMNDYTVTEVVREVSNNRDTDTYSITLENAATAESLTTYVAQEL